MIFPYRPKMIFLRAGSNDIHAGKTPQQVFDDFKEFVRVVHEKLPETEILFISLAPAISRWNEREANKELNNLVEAYAKTAPHVKYIESYDISLDKNGQPRPELFVADKLHFSPEGYKLLVERVRPYMPQK
jgi:lysophospholipase L1-like esterase